MSFSRNTLLAAAVLLTVAAAAQDTQACGRSRGYRGGYRGGYVRRVIPAAPYAPAYGSVTGVPAAPSQFVSQPAQPGFPQQPSVAPAPAPPAAPAPQTAPGQPLPGTQPSGSVQMTALQALAGTPSQPTQPVQPTTPAAPVNTPSVPTGNASSQTSLAGNWTARAGNGSTIRLTLQADGQFVWVATNRAGKTSSFSGRFTVGSGTLALVRTGDNQRLEGSMTISGQNTFRFQVSGKNAAALEFSRS